MSPRDALNRPLSDLRMSVTDRCNFRCTYCMPKEVFGHDFHFLPRADLLTYEEIARIAAVFVDLGVRKIRLTGGEPLLRRDLERLVAQLARLDDLEDLTLTTNGSLLTRDRAFALRDAGLKRITVSLDALDNEVFRKMNDVAFPVERVLEAIDSAVAAGLHPVKVDMVLKRGANETCIVPMAERFRNSGCILRFIEYMDAGTTNGWRLDDVVPADEVLARLSAVWPLEPVKQNYYGEVADRWRYLDGAGEIGIIASVTHPFCGSCTRARLSAEGHLYTCLFAATGQDLRAIVRSGAGDAALREAIAAAWSARTDRYSEIRTAATISMPKVEMSRIGG